MIVLGRVKDSNAKETNCYVPALHMLTTRTHTICV